jgi:uncharacterized membrane protein YgaE (UPF0421/DUF939 family)
MIRFRLRPDPPTRTAAMNQLMLARRKAQPAAAYIARMTLTAVAAYLLALLLPGTARPVLAPLTALLVLQASFFQTIRSAVTKVAGVTAGVLTAVAVAAYVPFSWWVLGLLIAGTLALGMVLRLGTDSLEVPISAMLIFSVDTHAAATARISDTLVGTAAGLAAGLLFARMRTQPAREAVSDVTQQMSKLLGQMSAGLAEVPEPRRAAEWLEGTRALRGEIDRLDDALSQAEESVRLNPRRLLLPNPAAGLREGVDTLERAATDMRVLARSVVDSSRIDSDDSPVRDDQTRASLAAVLGELAGAVTAYGQYLEAGAVAASEPDSQPAGTRRQLAGVGRRPLGSAARRPLATVARRPLAAVTRRPVGAGSAGRAPIARVPAARVAEGVQPAGVQPASAQLAGVQPAGVQPAGVQPAADRLQEHLAEAHRRQDDLADLLRTDPDEQPDGWPLRGEILAHVDRLRSELEPRRPPERSDSTGPFRVVGPRRGRLPRRLRRRRR